MKNRIRVKAKTVSRLRSNDDHVQVGDLVTSDFESKSVMTFIRATENYLGPLMGDGPVFRKHDIGLIVDIVVTPDSFYSQEFCRLLLCTGELGWLPSRWLKRITQKNIFII